MSRHQRNNERVARGLLLACAMSWGIVFCGTGAVAWGQPFRSSATFPQRPGAVSDLRLTIELPAARSGCFQAFKVRVEMSPGRVNQRTRRLRVRLATTGYAYWSVEQTSEVEIILEKGKRSAVATGTLLPSPGPARILLVETTDGGSRIDALCGTASMAGFPVNRWDEELTAFLVLDRDADISSLRQADTTATYPPGDGRLPDLRPLAFLHAQPAGVGPLDFAASQSASRPWTLSAARVWYERQISQRKPSSATCELRHPAASPLAWRDYGGCKLAILSFDDLTWWAGSGLSTFDAFRQWILMGGRAMILGADTAEKRAQVARHFEVRPEHAKWRFEKESGRKLALRLVHEWDFYAEDIHSFYNTMALQVPAQAEQTDAASRAVRIAKGLNPDAVRYCRAGWGLVLAVDEEKFNGSTANWLLVLFTGGHLAEPIAARMERYWRGSYDYANMVIPGVGEPPVDFFLVIITLFVLVIGPLNFYWFSDPRRRTWILVTIPAVALVTTVGFVVAAIIKDGFATRGRIRSATYLDQKNGMAYSWSHQSYFSALAPEGLKYPRGSYVLPVRKEELSYVSAGPSARYGVATSGQTELFSGDHIRARFCSQVVVGSIVPTERRLRVQVIDDKRIRVRNDLGSRIELLILRDRKGTWYDATNLADGAAERLAANDESNVEQAIAAWQTERRKVQRKLLISQFSGASKERIGLLGGGWHGGKWADKIMAPEIERLFAHLRLAPGEFAAIVSESSDVPRGISPDLVFPDLECVFGPW